MENYPIKTIDLDTAKELQFKIIDEITKVFRGTEILSRGDLGVVPGLNQPKTTKQAEAVIANVFSSDASVLLRGAGTSAIKWAIYAGQKIRPGKILLHTAPIYPTTMSSIDMMNVEIIQCNFNNLEEVERAIKENSDITTALVQYTRQELADSYDYGKVIQKIKASNSNIFVVTDDNYAVLKVDKIGIEYGADASCFSAFKIQGPEGIGVTVCTQEARDIIRQNNYSGGSQIQGYEAIDILRGMVNAPVALAVQSQIVDEVVSTINEEQIPGIKQAFVANAQSKVALVEFDEEIAQQVLKEAEKLGALPNPVGAESKYEFCPLFYRVSGTFLLSDPTLEKRMIRINPNRAGVKTIMRILLTAMEQANVSA